jgi:hypothetical protein
MTCAFCIKAYSAVAQRAYGNGKAVSAMLSDLNAAAIGEPLQATLLMLRQLTRERL